MSRIRTMTTAASSLGCLLLLGVGLGLLLPSPGEAQSLLSASGLGLPSEAPDARSRMVGSVGVVLRDSGVLPNDPASAGWSILPTISASGQAGGGRLGEIGDSYQARFPSMAIAYPHGGQVYSLTLSGVFSQEWDVEVDQLLDFSGDQVRAVDRFEGRGGIAVARLGVARRLLEDRVSVGATVGSHVGSLERRFTRELNADDVGPEVEPFVENGRWRAQGLTASAGAHWDVTSLLRVGGSVTWSEELRLDPTAETDGGTRVLSIPLELRGGASATLTPGLGVAASFYRADWSEAAAALEDPAAPGVVWQWGAGVEWNQASLLGRSLPLAVGYRQRDLPFSFLGSAAEESAITGGVGFHLTEGGDGAPSARIHVGAEQGTRSAGELEEDFWRVTFTLRLAGR